MKKARINISDREWLKRKLTEKYIEENKICDKITHLKNNISALCREIVTKYIYSKSDLELFEKSKRIINYCENFELVSTLLFSKSGKKISDDISYYPNTVIPKMGFDKNKNIIIRAYDTFRVNPDPNTPPLILVNNSIESYPTNFRFTKNIISRIPEGDKEVLKDALILYWDALYDKENYLIEYCSKDDYGNYTFLKDIVFMDQLKILNKDWYDLLVTKDDIKESKEDLFPVDNIKKSLSDLKNLIESKSLITKEYFE